jgi:SAM-dependent methyltransferase
MFLDFIRKFTQRRFKTADELYRLRTKWGELNERYGHQIFSSDHHRYTLPFMGNPLRESGEKKKWTNEDTLFYEYLDDDRREEAMRRFNFMYDLVKDRLSKDDVILDVGCNTGFFLNQWHERGYSNLRGLDPQGVAVEYAKEHRPHLDIKHGFFGPSENDISCDLMVWFGSIFRVPYRDRLFDAIDRTAKKYVLIWVQESLDDFIRDLHVGMAKKGFLCIEKRVVNRDYQPIGLKNTDGPLIELKEDTTERNFNSHFLFRRIEPLKD